MNASECARQVSGTFVLPDTCLKIKELIDDGVSDFAEMAELIQFDPVLSSRILKLANSALYNFPKQIDSVEKALQLLGDEQVYNLVVAYSAAETFAKVRVDVIDLERFWEQSIYCALIAKFLYQTLNIKGNDPIYLSGLLHNLGELVMVEVAPELTQKVALQVTGKMPWQRQREVFGFTYLECTTELMKCWQLPSSLYKPFNDIDRDSIDVVNTLRMVMHVAYSLSFAVTHPEHYNLTDLLAPAVLERLNLDEEQLQAAEDFAFMAGVSIIALFHPEQVAAI